MITKKPTPKQLEIIQYMCQGWELGFSTGFRSNPDRWRLQEGGIGRGGDTKLVRADVGRTLRDNGIIKGRGYGQQVFNLTDAGKVIAKEHGWIE